MVSLSYTFLVFLLFHLADSHDNVDLDELKVSRDP
ncbi:hypothetical protein QFZ20_002202 [Flavobacterium sp. W4I14]|nr:hypothetical protein [Flavobacterium sp. W4I14]